MFPVVAHGRQNFRFQKKICALRSSRSLVGCFLKNMSRAVQLLAVLLALGCAAAFRRDVDLVPEEFEDGLLFVDEFYPQPQIIPPPPSVDFVPSLYGASAVVCGAEGEERVYYFGGSLGVPPSFPLYQGSYGEAGLNTELYVLEVGKCH